ncbi:MAG: peptide ABC transporter substrate-binding protein, partial [Planctomycetes bacterium]|nr:peptide ABC transporter substrate-binding protein [Planctomycetota bacterium]
LRLNVTHPPLNDSRVRKALCMAIDKEALTTYVLKGGQIPAASFVPPGIPGYLTDAGPAIELDLDRARTLLADAGFPAGEGFPELHLLYSVDEASRDLAEVIALQFRKNLKIRVHPTAQERKGYFVSQNSLRYELCLCSWLGDYLDPTTFLDIFRGESGNNRTGWKCDEYNRLLDRAGLQGDADARAVLLREAEALLLSEAPLAPLFFRTTANMIKPEWEGYYDNIQDVHPLKYLRRNEP